MADITSFLWLRHLRAEASSHVLLYRSGRLVYSTRGLSAWFLPLSTSVAEVPVDDRELPFLFHGTSKDFQDVTIQGVITWRVADPETLAGRVDFHLDLGTGHHRQEPLSVIANQLTALARQLTEAYLVTHDLRALLVSGCDPVRDRVRQGLALDEGLSGSGLEIVSVRVASVSPSAELEKALGMPARERIQQAADEATFARRAMAVEKERAIEENELQNRIEAAAQEEQLITQRGANERRRMEEQALAMQIEVEAAASRKAIEAQAEAHRVEVVEAATVAAEVARMAIYEDLAPSVMLGLAAQELAGKLHTIEHLSLSPDTLGPLLTNLVTAGTRKLETGS